MKARQADLSLDNVRDDESAWLDFPVDDWVLGKDPHVRRVARNVKRAAVVDCTVLIAGETGTGKEVWANLIHRLGKRSNKPFIPINCAALTPSLAESQLFGHEKGAYTGAFGASLGAFRAADGGIVFLDEIGDMPLSLQPKLLRVLQNREVTPLGSSHPLPVNVQVVAATNRNLEQEVADGRFREDLFFRLNMCQLRIPPLRSRTEDIPLFVDFFSSKFSKQYQIPRWSPDATELEQFCSYHWPGNIRQLAHTIEQAYVLDTVPSLPNLPSDDRQRASSLPYVNLERLRETAIRQALRTTRGHKGKAARLLGVHANTLTRLLAAIESKHDEDQETVKDFVDPHLP